MKVVSIAEFPQKKKSIRFADLKFGDLFLIYGYMTSDLYIKMQPIYDAQDYEYNAVKVCDGGTFYFHPHERVERDAAGIGSKGFSN